MLLLLVLDPSSSSCRTVDTKSTRNGLSGMMDMDAMSIAVVSSLSSFVVDSSVDIVLLFVSVTRVGAYVDTSGLEEIILEGEVEGLVVTTNGALVSVSSNKSGASSNG